MKWNNTNKRWMMLDMVLDGCCGKQPFVDKKGDMIIVKCRKCGDSVERKESWEVMIAWNRRKRQKT
jgi:hypothetical protein